MPRRATTARRCIPPTGPTQDQGMLRPTRISRAMAGSTAMSLAGEDDGMAGTSTKGVGAESAPSKMTAAPSVSHVRTPAMSQWPFSRGI